MKTLYWLRNDLRLDDNLALHRAMEESLEVLCVYIFEDRFFEDGIHGGKRMDERRAFFIWQSVMELRETIRNRGSELIVLKGKAEDILPSLMHETGMDRLVYSNSVGYEEIQIERKLNSAIGNCEGIWNHTLIDMDNLPFSIEKAPKVFTPFRKKIEKYHSYPDPVRAPRTIPHFSGSKPKDDLIGFEDLGFKTPNHDERSVLEFHGGEMAAMERLQHYFWESESLSEYVETRNGMLGADYSSKFSPWLAQGCISARRIHSEVKRYESEIEENKSTYWLIFELLWRDFFQIVALKHGKELFFEFGWKGEFREWSTDQKKFNKWCEGKTNDPFVDANMKELNATGFMSNRGRQNVASFLTHQLKIDWRWGASYFEEKLIDYDVASNWGNWSYVSGTGNDPRKDRVFNTKLQAERYDPNGDYVRTWNK